MSEKPARTWLRQMMDFLASGRLAVILLALLVSLYLLYLWVPQWDPDLRFARGVWLEEHGAPGWILMVTGLTDIQRSVWLNVTYALLAVNLTLCMARRVRPALVLMKFPDRPPRPRPGWSHREVRTGGIDTAQVARTLKRYGFKTLVDGESVYGLRGRFSTAGHWLFHVSLLALMGVGIYLAATPEPFRGAAGIGEGEPFDLHAARFLATNDVSTADLDPLVFSVDRVEAQVANGEVRRFDVTVSTPDGTESEIGLNRPLRRAPYQVIANGFGYMPGWAVVDGSERMVAGAWVKLVPYPKSEEESFVFGPDGHMVHLTFYPDHRSHGERHRSASWDLRNPRFLARVEIPGRTVFEGLLEPGQRVSLENGTSFFFLPEIRRFVMVEVRQERGHLAVFATLGMMVLGLAIRYARIRKEILVELSSGTLHFHGHSEMLPGLFEEEMDLLAEVLTRRRELPAAREVLA